MTWALVAPDVAADLEPDLRRLCNVKSAGCGKPTASRAVRISGSTSSAVRGFKFLATRARAVGGAGYAWMYWSHVATGHAGPCAGYTGRVKGLFFGVLFVEFTTTLRPAGVTVISCRLIV